MLAKTLTLRWANLGIDSVRYAGTAEIQLALQAKKLGVFVKLNNELLRFASTVYPGVPYPYPKTTIVLGSADAGIAANSTRTPAAARSASRSRRPSRIVVLMVTDRLVGLRVGVRTETDGLDLSEHGEAIA